MRIIIFGQKWFGETIFKSLKNIADIVGVVAPDEDDRLWKLAKSYGVPILNKNSTQNWPECDLGLAVHYHNYIPAEERLACGRGVVGYHPSLLPLYRGKDSINQAIVDKLTTTGGTIFWLDDGWDTGKIIAQRPCVIYPGETAPELWRRALAPLGVELIKEFIANLRGEID